MTLTKDQVMAATDLVYDRFLMWQDPEGNTGDFAVKISDLADAAGVAELSDPDDLRRIKQMVEDEFSRYHFEADWMNSRYNPEAGLSDEEDAAFYRARPRRPAWPGGWLRLRKTSAPDPMRDRKDKIMSKRDAAAPISRALRLSEQVERGLTTESTAEYCLTAGRDAAMSLIGDHPEVESNVAKMLPS